MELWIRTPDKECLTKVNHLYIDDCNIKQQNGLILATYKTKERALQVLDEIQNKLMPISVYKQEVDNLTIDFKNIDTIIYEMPEE